MGYIIPATYAEAVKELETFNGHDDWFGTVYHLATFDPALHVNMLPEGTNDAYVCLVHIRSQSVCRVYRTDELGNPLNIDGSVPDAVNSLTGFIIGKPTRGFTKEADDPYQIIEMFMLMVLFGAQSMQPLKH